MTISHLFVEGFLFFYPFFFGSGFPYRLEQGTTITINERMRDTWY